MCSWNITSKVENICYFKIKIVSFVVDSGIEMTAYDKWINNSKNEAEKLVSCSFNFLSGMYTNGTKSE